MTVSSPSASGACTSPTALLVGVVLVLLRLHLQAYALDLLRFNSEPLQELFAGLLIAAEPAEARAVRMLLTAVDAEYHVRPSEFCCARVNLDLLMPWPSFAEEWAMFPAPRRWLAR